MILEPAALRKRIANQPQAKLKLAVSVADFSANIRACDLTSSRLGPSFGWGLCFGGDPTQAAAYVCLQIQSRRDRILKSRSLDVPGALYVIIRQLP
jgi:hypothetical protein